MNSRSKNQPVVLGIDPGTVSIGYALLEGGAPEPRLLKAGLVDITSSVNHKRLEELSAHIRLLIDNWKPSVLAIERLFFSKNQKTAMAVAEARGAILLTASLARLMVYEYTPLEIKKAVTGNGGSDKSSLQKMVRLTLPGTKDLEIKDDNVFDAIAVALTYFFKTARKIEKNYL